jgi:hypothetical protein
MSRAEESKPHDTMTTAVRRIPAATAADPPFPDELLEQIFLHQDDAADLARACAACMSFRRVITARPFLRHFRTFRSLHKPPALGFLNVFGFHLVDPPHRMAPAVARAADFTFSFPPPRRGAGPRSSATRATTASSAFHGWSAASSTTLLSATIPEHF